MSEDCAEDDQAAMGISPANFSGVTFPTQEDRKLYCELYDVVCEFFDGNDEKAQLWFALSNPMLGGVSPKQMITFGSIDRLKKFIETSLDENNPE